MHCTLSRLKRIHTATQLTHSFTKCIPNAHGSVFLIQQTGTFQVFSVPIYCKLFHSLLVLLSIRIATDFYHCVKLNGQTLKSRSLFVDPMCQKKNRVIAFAFALLYHGLSPLKRMLDVSYICTHWK